MMSTPFYKVRLLAPSAGWQLRLENDAEWRTVAAWASVEISISGDSMDIILPCLVTPDGCIEPTDLATEIREVTR